MHQEYTTGNLFQDEPRQENERDSYITARLLLNENLQSMNIDWHALGEYDIECLCRGLISEVKAMTNYELDYKKIWDFVCLRRLQKMNPDMEFDSHSRPCDMDYAVQYYKLKFHYDELPDYSKEELDAMLPDSASFVFHYKHYKSITNYRYVWNYDILRILPSRDDPFYDQKLERIHEFLQSTEVVAGEQFFQENWLLTRFLQRPPIAIFLNLERILEGLQYRCIKRCAPELGRSAWGENKMIIGDMRDEEFELLIEHLSESAGPAQYDESTMLVTQFSGQKKRIRLTRHQWKDDIPTLIDVNWHYRKFRNQQGILFKTVVTKFGVMYNPHTFILYAELSYIVEAHDGFEWKAV